jgi:uncharacterized repeat protein (TIGR01451 family)
MALVMAMSLVIAVTSTALAVDPGPKLTLKAKIEKEAKVLKDGKTITVKSDGNNPKHGDLLAYTITYKNEGTAVAKNAEIVNAVPQNTVYQLDSSAGKDTEISFSIDGGNVFQKPPVMYQGALAGGKQEKKPAPPEMFTTIKWVVTKPLPPGATGEVSFLVKVK